MARVFDTGGRWFLAVHNSSNAVAFPLDEVEGLWEYQGSCMVNWINPAKEPTKLAETYTEVIDAISTFKGNG